jgi:hypothetical protein
MSIASKSIIFIFILLIFPLTALSPLEGRINGDQRHSQDSILVARVYFSSFAELNSLASTLDIWEVDHQNGYFVALVSSSQLDELNQSGFQVEIDSIRTSFLTRRNQLLPGQLSGIPGYPCYRTVEETFSDLAQLAVDYPDLVTWIDIGDSWEKENSGGGSGYDLYTLIITNSAIPGPKPKFHLLSAIHAREYTTAELATRFAEYLVENYDRDPEITWLLDYYEVHITPQANPDGRKIAENGVYWRKNTDNDDGCLDSDWWGTDLNRNSSFKWGLPGSSSNSCDETYRGPASVSEPETQAIQSYASSIFPDQRSPEDDDPAPQDSSGLFITLHSFGDIVLFPWGWSPYPSPNNTPLETLGRKFGFYNGYEVCQSGEPGCIYQTSGSTDDWMYGELGVAAYTFELGSQFFESCSYFEDNIVPENLPALLYAFKAARRPYQSPSGPESLELELNEDHIPPGAEIVLTAQADDTRYNSSGWGDEPVQNIIAARFSIDQPSWMEGATTYPIAPLDGDFDNPVESLSVIINSAGWSMGRHTLFVESQDADGNWGVPSAIFLWITAEGYLPDLDPIDVEGNALRGTQLTYTFTLTNLSASEDTFDLQITGNTWDTFVETNPIGPLASGESFEFNVTIDIPESVEDGDQDIAVITAISQGDPNMQAAATIETAARSPAAFFPLVHN